MTHQAEIVEDIADEVTAVRPFDFKETFSEAPGASLPFDYNQDLGRINDDVRSEGSARSTTYAEVK